MQDFQIVVEIDPKRAQQGAQVVDRELERLLKEAQELRAALVGAVALPAQNVQAGGAAIERTLSDVQAEAAETRAAIGRIGDGAGNVSARLAEVEKNAADLRAELLQALNQNGAGTVAAVDRVADALDRAYELAVLTDVRIGRLGQNAKTPPGLKGLNDELGKTETKLRTLPSFVQRAVAGLSLLAAGRSFVQTADQLTNVSNRLRLVTSSSTELATVQQELLNIAGRTRTSFGGTAEIFNRVAVSAKELGVNNRQLLQFTESLNQAIVLSGASSQEAEAGLIQLSQGLASGTLRGDELRSVLEQLPAVADVIAKGLGVTRGELRKLGEQGKITSKDVLRAFQESREEIAGRFATTIPTVGQAFEVLKTRATELVGRLDAATGASRGLATALLAIADAANFVDQALIDTAADVAASTNAQGAAIQLTRRELETYSGTFRKLSADLAAGRISQAQFNAELAKARAAGDLQKLGDLSESQAKRVGFLRSELDRLTASARKTTLPSDQFAAQQKAAAEAAKIAEQTRDEQRRAADEALALQKKVLEDIRQPLQDYTDKQRALGALLAANKITQTEYNKALAELKPPDVGSGGGDVYADQLKALRDGNEELRIRATLSGTAEAVALAELELRQRGVTLSTTQRAQLALEVVERQKLTTQAEAQAAAEEKIDAARKRQGQRIAAIRDEIAGQGELNQKIADLLVLRRQEAALIPQIDALVQQLRIRQLEASQDLGDGFTLAFLKIKQEAEDFSVIGETAVSSFANNATEALVKLAETGKFSFRDFAQSILSDITRVIARLLVLQAIQAAVGVFGGGAGAGSLALSQSLNQGRARGGTVQPGQRPFPVGEDGPELFYPNRTGTIQPNAATAPRNRDGGAAGENNRPTMGVQVVNVLDPALVPDAIAAGLADEAIINRIGSNRETIKRLLS